MFMPIRFMYSLKLTDMALRAPITTGTTMTFRIIIIIIIIIIILLLLLLFILIITIL